MSQVVTYFFIALFVPNTDSNNFEYEKNVTIPEAGLPRCSVHASCFLRRKCRLPQFPACRFLYDDVGQSRFASAEAVSYTHLVGIAMGNACDEALNAADYVTATVDDDGIARALEHLGILDD